MKLTLNIWPGIEVFTLDLDLGEQPVPTPTNVVVKGVKKVSWAWVRGMLA